MADVLSPSEPLQPEASTSTPPRPLCSVCNHQYSIYTCPGCSARTCSLPCSTTHKSATGCTGERNKVAYVPMNKYGWGTMMNDYVFLEDIGRRVGDWGKKIVRGGYGMRGSSSRGERGSIGRGRGGRGRGRGGGHGGGRTKRDLLKLQLEARDIDMDFLPAGMERRKLNQSSWDFKNHTALLTIEFKFYPPIDPLAPSSQPRGHPFVILTHRNRITVPLLSLLQSHITDRINSKKDGTLPEWLKSFIFPDPEDPQSFTPPQCVMTAPLDPRTVVLSSSRTKTAFYRFDPLQTLGLSLKNTHFVEFPTIELWEEFRGIVVDTGGAVTQQPEEERKPKRRKLATRASKKAMSGLLDGYGSDEKEEESNNAFSMLDGYAGSDDETGREGRSQADDGELGDEDADGDTDDEIEMDPAVLLELMRQANGPDTLGEIVGREDGVDWGDSEEDEQE